MAREDLKTVINLKQEKVIENNVDITLEKTGSQDNSIKKNFNIFN